jgi:hypothetical protein
MNTTTSDKLKTAAVEILKLNDGNVTKAAAKLASALMENQRRPLLIALAADYLERISKTVEASAEEAAAPLKKKREPSSRRREGPHRRIKLGTPTAAQKAGTVAAGKVIKHEIFERRIRGAGRLGDIHIHELRAIAESQASTATSFLQRGYDDAVESILLLMLNDHCVASEPFVKVRDAVPPGVVEAKLKAAKLKAAEVIRDGSIRVAHDLIASAHKIEPIEDARQ